MREKVDFLEKLRRNRESMRLNIAPGYGLAKSEMVFRYMDATGNTVKTESVSEQQITYNVITGAVNKKYPLPEGIKDRATSKAWARILRALNRAVDAETPESFIEVSAEGAEFLQDALGPYGVDARTVIVKEDILDALEAILREEKASRNGTAKRESAETRA
jgi:hypothetical protein